MKFTILTSLSTPHPCDAFAIRVNIHAALPPLKSGQARVDQPASRQARARLETQHTIRAGKASC